MPVISPLKSLSQRRLNLAALLACLALAAAQAQEELPTDRLLRTLQPTADVNDFAGILTPTQRDALEERCKSLREKAGAQLAVVTLKSLEGGQVDDFAVKLFKRWGIGDKEKKNGILLLVAIQDPKPASRSATAWSRSCPTRSPAASSRNSSFQLSASNVMPMGWRQPSIASLRSLNGTNLRHRTSAGEQLNRRPSARPLFSSLSPPC